MTHITTQWDEEIARYEKLVADANARGTQGHIWNNEHRLALAKAEAYRRAKAEDAPLLEALLELEEAFSFADLPSSGRQDFEERLWALRPRVQDAIATTKGRTP